MEVIKIQKFKNNFNVVIKDDEQNTELRTTNNYYPCVGKYIADNIEKYMDDYVVDINDTNCFFSQLFKSLEIDKIISLVKTAQQHKYLRHSYILNEEEYNKDLVILRNTDYNRVLKDKKIGFCVCLNFQELKFCKRVIKNEKIHHIIILKSNEDEDRELLNYSLICGYSIYHMTPKGVIRADRDNLNAYPIVLKSRGSLLKDLIVLRFD